MERKFHDGESVYLIDNKTGERYLSEILGYSKLWGYTLVDNTVSFYLGFPYIANENELEKTGDKFNFDKESQDRFYRNNQELCCSAGLVTKYNVDMFIGRGV
jgi:hypothetical protein